MFVAVQPQNIVTISEYVPDHSSDVDRSAFAAILDVVIEAAVPDQAITVQVSCEDICVFGRHYKPHNANLPLQGFKAAFSDSADASLVPTVCAMLETDAGNVKESEDPGWMARVLQPTKLHGHHGPALVDIGSTQAFIDYYSKDGRLPVWWDVDGF